ncbi:MAG: RIP metalloprotease RseP, partial [Verrucomicrobia bacterium]|nr:RIP metalloprotease RseP [Verrucomicrobiota bacterium]
FLVAIKLGLVVDAFSIGFGPPIWKREIRGIVFKVCWFPLGGYVALPQLDPSGMATVQGTEKPEDEAEEAPEVRELPDVTPAKKIAVSVAGAAGNIMFAVVLSWIIWLSPGAITYKGAPIVGSVDTESVAFAEGLRVGDEILSLNGESVATWYDLSMESLLIGESSGVSLAVKRGKEELEMTIPLVLAEGAEVPILAGVERRAVPCLLKAIMPGGSAERAGLQANDIVKSLDGIAVHGAQDLVALVGERSEREIHLVIERDGEEMEFVVVPAYSEEHERGLIGVRPVDVIMPWMHEKRPVAQLRADALGIVRLLKALVTPSESKHAASGLGGPVMIFAALWMAIKISIFNAVGFLRFLNVNLAILNLLPIPVLDGGHIMFSLWEAITRRKAHPKFVNILVNAFAVVLIGVFLLLTCRDVDRLFPGIKNLLHREAATNVVEEVSEP